MYRLVLMRHGKSAYPDGVADHDRPLDLRGRMASGLMGLMLRELVLEPDHAFVSTAMRAQETFTHLSIGLGAIVPHTSREDLYCSGADNLLTCLRAAPESARTIIMIGHEPQTSAFLFNLIGRTEELGVADRAREKFPTAAMAVLNFGDLSGWPALGFGAAEAEAFICPKDLV